jgi:septal ring factor EnvC (AmiA/AmiB activator)
MNYYIKRIAPMFCAAIFTLASCTETKTTTEEEVEITKMDSTSKEVKETTAKLEEETEKVEESLEKLDEEFETAK